MHLLAYCIFGQYCFEISGNDSFDIFVSCQFLNINITMEDDTGSKILVCFPEDKLCGNLHSSIENCIDFGKIS